jgi:hypothetical protein
MMGAEGGEVGEGKGEMKKVYCRLATLAWKAARVGAEAVSAGRLFHSGIVRGKNVFCR